MNEIWNSKSSYNRFKMFSVTHILTLILILCLIILIYLIRDRIKNSNKLDKYLRIILAVIMILAEISTYCWAVINGVFDLGSSLPLTLCGMNVYLAFILILNKSYFLYEILLFMGLLGSLQAVLTPDITYTFPHIRYIQFFATHGGVLVTIFYMTFVFDFKPKVISIIKTYIILILYAIPVGIFNFFVNGNYLFLVHKPESASLLDYFGPWPWYIMVVLISILPYFFFIYFLFTLRILLLNLK